MKKYEEKIESVAFDYPIESIADPEKILFLDIETTGFTANSSSLYLIGCVYHSFDGYYTLQWFAQNESEEEAILKAFIEFSSSFTHLIHFNGNRFDVPYLEAKCKQYGLEMDFKRFIGVDLYKRISSMKSFLGLPGCKQKDVEAFLGIGREDTYSGGELINVYHEYTKEPSDYSETLLLLHNREDIIGMLALLPMLSYSDLLEAGIHATKVVANRFPDLNGQIKKELLIHTALPHVVPKPVSRYYQGCYIKLDASEAVIKVPLFEEEMKYFYSNYKDYYYLPTEDVALHKSVAASVDKEHRKNATAATCYTRKESSYLPQFDCIVEPFFKRSYEEKDLFFELTPERKTDRELFDVYATHLVHTILSEC